MVWYGVLDAGPGGCEEHAVRGSAIDIQRTQVLSNQEHPAHLLRLTC